MTDFDSFWATYPRKEGKTDARIRWDKVIKDTSPEVIIKALERQVLAGVFEQKREQARRQGMPRDHFIKQPARWLNAGCWEDEIAPCQRTPFRNGAAELLAREWMEPTIEESATPPGMIEGPAHG